MLLIFDKVSARLWLGLVIKCCVVFPWFYKFFVVELTSPRIDSPRVSLSANIQ